jgi:hypothetical protein
MDKYTQCQIWGEILGLEPNIVSLYLEDASICPAAYIPISLLQNPANAFWMYIMHLQGWEIDWVRKLATADLVEFPYSELGKFPYSELGEALSCFVRAHDKNTVVRLLTVKTKGELSSYSLLSDTITCWMWLKENSPEVLEQRPRIRDLFQYHDWCYKQKVHLEPAFDLPINKEVQSQIGPTFEGFEVVFPNSTRDLKAWGHTLSHCVGGYGEAIKQGRSIIFSLNKQGTSCYTVELISNPQGWVLNQFYGYKNSPAPTVLREKMYQIFGRRKNIFNTN